MAFSNQINWCNYGPYKIVDINNKEHERVLQFMLAYFRGHRLLQVLKVQQEPGIETEFLKIVRHILRNESSFMIVSDELNDTSSIKGVALLMCMTKKSRSWTYLQLSLDSERFKELCALIIWCLEQEVVRVKDHTGGDSLHLFTFCLCQDLAEDQEFLAYFFNAICEVARHMHMPRVTTVCLEKIHQNRMRAAGFQELVRIVYSLFMYQNRRPFDRLRDINEMYGVFFEKKVVALVPYQDMSVGLERMTVAQEELKSDEGDLEED